MEKTLTLLLVEDAQPTVDFLRSVFDAGPIRFVHAGTVREGLEAARAERPDVVLLDVNLPDGDGLESVPQYGRVPVIAFSSIHPDELRDRAISAGCSCYLHKPFKLHELALHIARCLKTPHLSRSVS